MPVAEHIATGVFGDGSDRVIAAATVHHDRGGDTIPPVAFSSVVCPRQGAFSGPRRRQEL